MTEPRDIEREQSMANTVAAFAPVWTSQGILNLPTIAKHPTVAALRDRFKGKPAVLIAPGPSLAKNIHILPSLKGRALLMTYSRCLHALDRAGVVPDTVTCLDPLDLNYHFDGYDTSRLEAMILGMTANPGLYALPRKRLFTFSGNAAIESWIWGLLEGGDAALDTSCSVATTTTSLAILAGCDPIIYLGQDLSFPGGKYWHADTSDGAAHMIEPDAIPEEEAQQRAKDREVFGSLARIGFQPAIDGLRVMDEDERWRSAGCGIAGLSPNAQRVEQTGKALLSRIGDVRQVKANPCQDPAPEDGETYAATPSFTWVREWLEKRAKDHPGRFINCTEGGAYIDGMDHQFLTDVIAERIPQEPLNVGAVMDNAYKAIDSGKRQRRAYKAIKHWERALVRGGRHASKLHDTIADDPTDLRSAAKAIRHVFRLDHSLRHSQILGSMAAHNELGQVLERSKQAETVADVYEVMRGLCACAHQARNAAVPLLRRVRLEMEGAV